MEQEYTVLQFKKGDFQDAHKNFWCDMALEGVSEPVRIVVKDPTKYSNGMKLYGHITDEVSKAGKPYQRFRKAQQQESGSQGSKSGQSDEYWANKDTQIKAQWAIGQAIQFAKDATIDANEYPSIDTFIEEKAKQLFAMVDRVKLGEPEEKEEEEDKTEEIDQNDLDITTNLDELPY